MLDHLRSCAVLRGLLHALRLALPTLATLLALPAISRAGCTDGTDCVCDQPSISSDPRLLWCEDWEAITLTGGAGTGALGEIGPGSGPSACVPGNAAANCYGNTSAPLYGPPYDPTPWGIFQGSITRGVNGYLMHLYGNAATACAWALNEPSSPTLGRQTTTGSNGWTPRVFSPGDAWSAGSNKACIDVLREGTASSEVALGDFPIRPDGTRGPIGSQTFAYRLLNASGNVARGDISARKPLTVVENVSFTFLVAYSRGAESSAVWSQPWKHEETGAPGHYPFLFCHDGLEESCPFRSGWYSSDASALSASMTVRKGTKFVGSAAQVRAATADYQRSTHFADMNRWACVRTRILNVGRSDMSVATWADFGDGSGDHLILDFDLDGSMLTDGVNAISEFAFDAYSNAIQNGVTVSAPVRRFLDSIIVRGGSDAQCAGGACDPVSCASAGFYAAGQPGPTLAPLRFEP